LNGEFDVLFGRRREECTQAWNGGPRYDWRYREERRVNGRYCGMKEFIGRR
jgi:hypothetical protein